MNSTKARCLLLACGNTLRGDDGIGPWLAGWAEERFSGEPAVKVISRQQWTPELAVDIAAAESVLFVDCSAASAPGAVDLCDVQPTLETGQVGTHQVNAAQLLGMAQDLFGSLPRRAQVLTIGAGSMELSEEFSTDVLEAIPLACGLLEKAIVEMLAGK
jgi:hydrogenase maturation protease